jgi:nicotinamide mononucleotide (NMN) deamidase PncC
METLWAFIVIITGTVLPPDGATEEERQGFVFIEVTNTTVMHFDSQEACESANQKMLASADIVAQGLYNSKVEVSGCKPIEFTVE